MNYALIVSIFFRLLNFFTLIGIAVYLYKKYIHTQIVEDIASQDRFIGGLHQEINTLARYGNEMTATLQEQQENYGQFEKKIQLWADSIKHDAHMHLCEKNNRMHELKQRTILRAQSIERQAIAKKVMPLMLEKTENIVRHQIEQLGQQYLDSIIARIEKVEHAQESDLSDTNLLHNNAIKKSGQ